MPGGDETIEVRLARAEKAGAHLRHENERLKRRQEAEDYGEELRQALVTAALAGRIASPVRHDELLAMVAETAAHVISAGKAVLFLVSEDGERLELAARFGSGRGDTHHPIAPMVVMSGQAQAMAGENGEEAVVCLPLQYHDRVIGALELYEPVGGLPFSAADIHLLSLFAGQAAVTVEQSRSHRNLARLVVEVLQSMGDLSAEESEALRRGAGRFGRYVEEEDASYRRAIELAELVVEIALPGERDFEACRSVLQTFATYARGRRGEAHPEV